MHRVKEPELIINFCPIKDYDKKDYLETKKDVKKFAKEIIFNKETINSGVVGLLSKFGSGKSFFMQYLFCYLYNIKEENKNNYIKSKILNDKDNIYTHPIYPVYIDISKYENSYDNILLLIFAEIFNVLERIEENVKNNKKIIDKLSNIKEILKSIIPSAVKVGSSVLAKKFNKYEDIINFAGEISKNISEIILDSITIENEYLKKLENFSKKAPLMILIDNLDRCRPEFVLDFFVLIKRMFNVENVLFVIAYDKQQIINLLRTLYSDDIDISSYIKKYIPTEFYLLQKSNVIKYANQFINIGKIREDLVKTIFGNQKNKEIYTIKKCKLAIILWIKIYKKTKLSLRQFEQGIELIKLIYRKVPNINHIILKNANDEKIQKANLDLLVELMLIYMKSVYPYQYQNLYDFMQWKKDGIMEKDDIKYIFDKYKNKHKYDIFIKDMDRVIESIYGCFEKLQDEYLENTNKKVEIISLDEDLRKSLIELISSDNINIRVKLERIELHNEDKSK